MKRYEMMDCDAEYVSWLTPITNIGASAEGAVITTRFAPP